MSIEDKMANALKEYKIKKACYILEINACNVEGNMNMDRMVQ